MSDVSCGVLVQDGDPGDYILPEDAGPVWITIDGYAIYITRTYLGDVVITVYQDGQEMEPEVAHLAVPRLEETR